MKQNTGLSPIHALIISLSLLVAGLSLCATSALAEEYKAPKWDITADKMTRYEDPPSIIAEGNVLLKKTQEVIKQQKQTTDWNELLEEQETTKDKDETTEDEGKVKTITKTKTLTTIRADWIVYDINLGSIKARGNVLVKVGTDKLQAAKGEIDLNSETGTFTDASIIRKEKDLHLEGKIIEKTGDLTYHIEDGWVITCKLKDGETPPWSFGSKDAQITDGGYAVLKHATFRIKDFPVLYTPWMMLPVKRTRQTGFLFPSISSSNRDGFGVNLPFFLNISPSSDITIYPEYMTNRGLMGGLEFRYITSPQNKGGFMANYLYDELSDPSEVDYYNDGNYTHTNQDRYWVRGKFDHDIEGWTTRLDIDIVSDRDYLTEFTSGITGFNASNERFLEVFGRGFENKSIDQRKNSLRILKSWTNMSLQGDLIAINDVRPDETPTPTLIEGELIEGELIENSEVPQPISSPTPIWELPAINFTGLLPIGETLINFDWDVDYVNFWRENGVGSHRFDLFPRLSAPIPLGNYLEATAELGMRETAYLIQEYGDSDWQGSDTENRFLVDFQTEIGSTLIRDFNVNIGKAHTLSHTVRPYTNYRYIPDVDQEDLPQFDRTDRIDDRNIIYYGLDNWFKVIGSRNDTDDERKYGTIKIKQGYDFRSEKSDIPLTPVNVRIDYWPINDLWFLYRTDIDVYGDGAIKHSFEGGYRNSRGDILSADYRFDKYRDTESITADAKVHLFYKLLAGYSIEQSLADSKIVEQNIALIYQPSCWSVELSSNYTPGNQTILLTFRLANIGNPLGVDFGGF